MMAGVMSCGPSQLTPANGCWNVWLEIPTV